MIKWTTPSLECSVPTDLDFDYILFTLVQGDYVIEKMVAKEQVEDDKFSIIFTQEETGGFKLFTSIEAQINAMKGDVRVATNIEKLTIEKNLHDGTIPPMPPQLEITQNGRYIVSNYLYADVNVQPTGTLEIIQNGEYDVSNYARVIVNIEEV